MILYVNVKRWFRWEKRRGQALLIAEKTFTAESAENAEGFIFKTKGQQLKTCTAESAENAEGFILKQRATTTNIGGQAFLIVVIGKNILTQRR